MKQSNKSIVIGKGNECPKCSKLMERKKHPPHWKNTKTYFYTEWDYCKPCGHVQHYDEFKSIAWREAESRESFFRDMRI